MYRLLLFVIKIILLIKNNHSTPLDDFVNQHNSVYDWELLQAYPSPVYIVYIHMIKLQEIYPRMIS